ncbi:MAG: DUF4157 domain-containing protein [Mariprofundaceae bacterium]
MEFASKTRHAKPVQRAKPSRVAPSRPVNRDSQAEISRVLRSIGAQTKLSIGQPNDKYEQEADRVADQVMTDQIVAPISSMDASRLPSSAGPSTQLKSNEYENEDEVQKKGIQRQTQAEEEEEPVQTKRIQRQAQPEEEEKPVQTKRIQRQAQPEEEEVQACLQRMSNEEEDVQAKLSRKPTGYLQAKGTPELSDDAEQKIQQMRGQDDPLPKGVRQETENKIGADFSTVRIHNNSAANDINKQINARAFTLGNDIYFASGEYSPTTASGKKLLAHELTHVVQQSSAVQRKQIQRVANAEASVTQEEAQRKLKIFKLPPIKARHLQCYHQWAASNKLIRVANYARGNPNQKDAVWLNGENVTLPQSKLDALDLDPSLEEEKTIKVHEQPITGTYNGLIKKLKVPNWNRSGEFLSHPLEVDHIVELQTGNWKGSGPANNIENMELLDKSSNASSGSGVRNSIRRNVRQYLKDTGSSSRPNRAAIDGYLEQHDITFCNVEIDSRGRNESGSSYWTRAQIQAGEHLSNAHPIRNVGEAGEANCFALTSPGGHSVLHNYGHDESQLSINVEDTLGQKPVAGLCITHINLDQDYTQKESGNQFGHVVAHWALPEKLNAPEVPFQISLQKKSQYAGFLGEIPSTLEADYQGLSPVSFPSLSLNNDRVVANGQLTPSIPILGETPIEVSLDGENFEFGYYFRPDDIHSPIPGLNIDEVSLAVFAGSQGFGVEGEIDFFITQVGVGNLIARISTQNAFEAEGTFDFDNKLFDRATARLWYRNDAIGGEGILGIDSPDKIKGIQSAEITVGFSENSFTAEGRVSPDIPGVEEAGLNIEYSEEEGLLIGGNLELNSDTPGIRSGGVNVTLRKQENEWVVTATGTAIPDISGIDSEMAISYNDGAFTAEVTADYSRGMLSGQVNAGVTNRSVGEDGELSETAEPGNPLIVYGGGNLTIEIAPWLQGTAGVRFAPNGEITVTGEIGLPSEFEIFPRREVEKSIFSIAVQAPIFPGIVAEIGGGLGATAGFGPGVLDQLQLGITYNPAHEEDTTITGDAHLKVPADAGLRLSLRAGIGVGITGASVTGGLEIGGSLGIEGAAEAGVHVEWSPSQGLELMANVGVHAQPAFVFDVGGYVSVRALGFSVYDQTWNFASFRFGSDYRFGITLPIHYREGEPFNISLSDVQFEVPNIDTDQLLKGLIARVA